ncbi:Optic atrophy 3-like protein [Corchorus olitorius]|uniref:Optic atrophy 3-like protein n=1 Tax=Corchorus olitorius TaxID=93759 RepID=A0A1R3KT00_9ROSI|nr:Optic atrophy 3-like protein [Corchorus olitorius]
MILPVVKLGTLALKTACKPIANRLKKEAGLHPRFRQFIINIAQANHRFTTRMQRRIYGHATDVEIRPLDEEKAVQAAADLLGELFVFTVLSAYCYDVNECMLKSKRINAVVAGAAVIFEVQRSSRAEARKEEQHKQELQAMKQRDEDLAREVELLKQKVEEIEQLARGRGLVGLFNFRHAHGTDGKAAPS